MRTLDMETNGKFEVVTRSSKYLIDLTNNGNFMARLPGNAASELRGDEKWIDLIKIVRCEVGASAVFFIKHADGGYPYYEGTSQITTPVTEITRLFDVHI